MHVLSLGEREDVEWVGVPCGLDAVACGASGDIARASPPLTNPLIQRRVDLNQNGQIITRQRFDKLNLAFAMGPHVTVPVIVEDFVHEQRIVIRIFVGHAIKMLGEGLE